MKKIAIIQPSSELYGSDRVMLTVAKTMSDAQLHIYLPKKGALLDFIKKEIPSAKIIISPELPIIQRSMFNFKGLFGVVREMTRFKKFFLRENDVHQYEMIYVNTLASVLLLWTVRKLKIPKVIHVHEIIENPKIVARCISWFAVKYADKVVCVSKAVKDNLREYCNLKFDDVIIIRNGIKPITEKLHLPNFKIEFFLFGRIKPEKGQWYLLEALKQVNKEILEYANFNIVGGTVQGSEYLIDELNSIII